MAYGPSHGVYWGLGLTQLLKQFVTGRKNATIIDETFFASSLLIFILPLQFL